MALLENALCRIISMENVDDEIKKTIREWLSYLLDQRRYSSNTVDAYATDFINFLLFFMHHSQQIITLDLMLQANIKDFRSWLAYRKIQKVQNTSNARGLSALRSFFAYVYKNLGQQNHNINAIKAGKKSQKLPRALNEDHAVAALEGLVNAGCMEPEWLRWRNIAILLLLYGSGLRISEVLDICMQDCCFEDDLELEESERISLSQKYIASIIVIGKGSKERLTPVLPAVSYAIIKYLELVPYDTTGPIFIGVNGKKLQSSVFRSRLRQLRQE